MNAFFRISGLVLMVSAVGLLGQGCAGDGGTSGSTQSSGSSSSGGTSTASGMTTNQAAINIIKKSESLKLKAYQGLSGKWFIGYGHSAGVKSGMTITESKAEQYLRDDLKAIESSIASTVKVPVNRNEFSAMVSLAYNIGTGAFRDSTVAKKINGGDRKAAADAFLLWNKGRKNGKLVVLSHLDERRKEERALFLK